MVRGIDIFKKYFEAYSDNYIIIGGTACDLIIHEAGFVPRATKDIDIILVVEALSTEFVKQFWQFIKDGNFDRNEKSEDERKYYRFIQPANIDFPFQIELFSRNPDLLDLDEATHLTPIPVGDDLSSLSAILLNDDYYNYMLEHSVIENGIHLAKTEALICLKAKAYLDIAGRIAKGENEDKKKLRKHKGDVFRLAVMLAANDWFELPQSIKTDLQVFVDAIVADLPGKELFKGMGLGNISVENVLNQIIKNFKLKDN
ncbi:MAG: hypothetical protein K9H64_10785 [Bacteroidales bacterium]|nr:hypothetical protein [Bacteroidales bacterium]MCF8456416.1 hypothetical protein [Bacteroidales bacterium]